MPDTLDGITTEELQRKREREQKITEAKDKVCAAAGTWADNISEWIWDAPAPETVAAMDRDLFDAVAELRRVEAE